MGAAGTQNEALAFGGCNNPTFSCTERYNGTSWFVGGALIAGRCQLAGAGTQNSALAFGGYSGSPCTEEYTSTSELNTITLSVNPNTGTLILSQVSASLNFADDTDASAGGIPLGGLYRNEEGFMKIRVT